MKILNFNNFYKKETKLPILIDNNEMKIFTPLEDIKNFHNLVFLAGTCPRKNQNQIDWRIEFINKLNASKFNGDVVNPTNPNYDNTVENYYNKQCSWETEGLHLASAIVFWVDRDKEHPALTTNIEFGIWSNNAPQSLFVGVPENSEHCDYIKWVCEKKGIKFFNSMDSIITALNEKFNKPISSYFTSDTHFSSERHLKLSQRPFINIDEMDAEMCSRWNKTIKSNDVIIHLGDFGNFEMLHKLNFGKMVLLKGNYEKDDNNFSITDNRVEVVNNLSFELDGEIITCVHEPISGKSGTFFLFGHIHEKSKVKKNGFNVGVDSNNYKPIDLTTIRFYKNAILNYYDDNVFCDKCK